MTRRAIVRVESISHKNYCICVIDEIGNRYYLQEYEAYDFARDKIYIHDVDTTLYFANARVCAEFTGLVTN